MGDRWWRVSHGGKYTVTTAKTAHEAWHRTNKYFAGAPGFSAVGVRATQPTEREMMWARKRGLHVQ